MEDHQYAQAIELIDDVGLGISEDMVSQVKGTGRPDLDEDEEDESTDVAEQASLLSDCEEDYVSEVAVGSLSLIIPEGGAHDKSLRLEASNTGDRTVEVQVSPNEEISFGDGPLNLERPERGDSASPIVLTEERNILPWQTFPETSFLSESDEDVLFDPMPNAKVHSKQASIKPIEKSFGDGPMNVVHPTTADSLLPTFPSMLTAEVVEAVEENTQSLHTYSKTNFLSESDEDVPFDPRPDAKELFKQPSGMPVDNLGASAGKVFIPESREVMPQNLLSPKLDHVGGVMLGLGSKAGQDSGADRLEADSTSPVKLEMKETTRREGKVMRLGSKEAEELLQLDLTKMGRAILPSVKKGGTGAKSPKANGVGWGVDDLGPDELSRYVETLEVKETYLDTVLDMEDVLLDSDDNHRPHGFLPNKSMLANRVQRIERDGGLTASSSGVPWAVSNGSPHLSTNRLVEVAWVEVVGARQRRGGASFSERVVGVQEHTVYRILVRGTDGQEWEVERRYRDFVFLFQQLNRTFPAGNGVILPAPWDRVRAESRKLFGNTSPNVVEVRSALIQVCLQSLLQAGPPLSTASPFLRFLFPTTWSATQSTGLPRAASEDLQATGSHMSLDELGSEPALSPMSDTSSAVVDGDMEAKSGAQSVFGKTIRLKLEVHKKRPLAQQMQSQHHACAGCYRPLTFSVGLIPGLAQSFGFSGPRWCEYSGQLYCSSCHLNETAVIPAYVVQHWDFGLRPVSQLAKAYLDSIYDKPMLCVSAVNPYLYFRVPILVHLRETRKRLSKILACIRCPSRSRIHGMVGSRRYLLESNDFYALRDLTDLSKGAFAGLPAFMNTLLEKLTVHVKRECSICHEMGEPCGAAKFCRDPLDIIFPFQEDGVVRCVICQVPFHKVCFKLIKICPSCSGESSLDIVEISQTEERTSISDVDVSVLPSKSSADASLAPDGSALVDANRQSKIKIPGFLSGILTPKDSGIRETNPGRQDSVVLDMMSGPLEL
ncbi:hypothetical protein KC19_10G020500 [Ceratodon purpureus]|uniref:PX domain-containing protein n=1 Tax=Ceratodon purpureus TaxID=3225 RepID=A0A8T0GKT5_CERPU|nr:hypothetical protein KC19_10G020500 [Ceratodon purpureus]